MLGVGNRVWCLEILGILFLCIFKRGLREVDWFVKKGNLVNLSKLIFCFNLE